MRKLLILLCVFTMLFQIWGGAPVWAKDDGDRGSSGIIGKQVDEYYDNPDNSPGLMERSISDVLISSANFLIQSFGMKDVTLLVFGKNSNLTADGFLQGGSAGSEYLYLGVFTAGMMNAVDALYSTFERMMPIPVVIAVLLIAVLMLFQSMSSESRSKGKDYVTAFLVGLLSIRFGHYLWALVSYVSTKFTELVWATMVDYGIKPDLFLNMIWGNGAEGYSKMIEYRGFVVAVLVLLAAIMTAMLNYQYTLRTIMLMILVSTFVVAAVLTIFPKFRHSLQTWWDLFISYMLMPCAHALALGLFFLLLRFSSDGVSNWVIVAYLFGFSAIQGLVSKLWGDSESKQRSGLGAMFGIGSMMALGRMFRPNGQSGRAGKQKSQQSVPTEGDGQQIYEAPSGSLVPSEGTASIPGRAMANISPTGSWKQKAVRTGGRVAGLALNYGTKMAGATAGTSIGLMAGNPIMGAVLGAKVGGWAGKGVESLAKGGFWLGNKAVKGIQQMRNTSSSEPIEAVQSDMVTSPMNTNVMSGGEGVSYTTISGQAGQGETGSEAGVTLSEGQMRLHTPVSTGTTPTVSPVSGSENSVKLRGTVSRQEMMSHQEGTEASFKQDVQTVQMNSSGSSTRSVVASVPNTSTQAAEQPVRNRVKTITENIRSPQQMISSRTTNVHEERVQEFEQIQSPNSQNRSSRQPTRPMNNPDQYQQGEIPLPEPSPERPRGKYYNYDL